MTGVYLTDLTFIEDGIPSLIKKSDLINFAKRTKTAEVIRDIQQYQNVPYTLQPVGDLQDYILSNMQAAGDVHDMYDKSLAVEPREREDEKIARYVVLFLKCSPQSMSPYGFGDLRQFALMLGGDCPSGLIYGSSGWSSTRHGYENI
jgi:hypothetical protein